MVTLKDFLDLDFCICGIDIDLRAPSKLVERHIIGLTGWAGSHWDYVEEINEDIALFTDNTQSFVYIHNKPLNFHQTDKPYRGPCRPWGVEYDVIPKAFLSMKVSQIRPSSVSFKGRHSNGSYYSIWLEVPEGFNFISTMREPEKEEDINVTFDDILEE